MSGFRKPSGFENDPSSSNFGDGDSSFNPNTVSTPFQQNSEDVAMAKLEGFSIGSIPLTNKEMEDEITERLTRFYFTANYHQNLQLPIIILPSIPYETLLGYYKYVVEVLVGHKFFEELPEGGKQVAHKGLEEILIMAKCDVPYAASDLRDGDYNIGAHSWGRFLAPLNWLCKTVDGFGLHNFKETVREENQGRLSFSDQTKVEMKELDQEIEDAEQRLIEKDKSQKEEAEKLDTELANAQQNCTIEIEKLASLKRAMAQINDVWDRLRAKLKESELKMAELVERTRNLQVIEKMMEEISQENKHQEEKNNSFDSQRKL